MKRKIIEIRLCQSCRGLAAVLAGMAMFVTAACAEPSKNFFSNPGFELGRDGWNLSLAGKTDGKFSVDEREAAEGQRSAMVTIGAVEQWGAQFGQTFAAGEKGKTYTFAVLAKSAKGPVEVGLQIERNADPYDRPKGAEKYFTLTSEWQEFHLTFKVEKDFKQGWFGYLSCNKPNVQFRADLFRLYEGEYVPREKLEQPGPGGITVRLFDSGAPSNLPLFGESILKKAGWTEVPEDDLSHAFKGGAVFQNDRLALALRRGATGAEVYSLGGDGAELRTVLTPLAGGNAGKLASFKLVENNPGGGVVDAVFAAVDGKPVTVRYELRPGQCYVQTEARNGATGLRVAAPCRFVVMPDFFADDIVIDSRDLPVSSTELPSDNFLLHLLPGGNAIVMSVVKTSDEDIHVALSGEGDTRMIESSELRYGKDGKIWVAVLAAPSIWHTRYVANEQAGKTVRLDWKAPFPAQWRADWRREGNLTDSWEMIAERPDGNYSKHAMFGEPGTIPSDRKRWTTVLGNFSYPCWLDKSGQGYFQPLKGEALHFQGSAVIYPVNRTSATALDTFTVVDIVRNTLGVGPCEYILDVEGQQSQYKGRATCSVRDTLNPIYGKGQQKQQRAEIERVLADLMIFIRHIRGRIETYVAFGHESLTYLGEQRKSHPELAPRIEELEAIARMFDAKVAARRTEIKTPDQAAETVEEFRKTVLDYDGADAPARCKRFTEAWVGIGGNQDELVGECRWTVKMIRQRAGLLMAIDPRMSEIAKEIRARSQVVLRNPANHEGATH